MNKKVHSYCGYAFFIYKYFLISSITSLLEKVIRSFSELTAYFKTYATAFYPEYRPCIDNAPYKTFQV